MVLAIVSGVAASVSLGDQPRTQSSKTKTIAVCPSARKALNYYQRQTAAWHSKMGAAVSGRTLRSTHPVACPQIRYLVKLARAQAHRARIEYQKWAYDWAWWKWMPDKWQRVGACETGYGKRPGDFRWNSGAYQGFVGFYYGSWDAYRPSNFPSEAYEATPRQQMIVAERIRAENGYGAWGCGAA